MAVTLIGLRSAGKTVGTSPSGRRVYLMHSDTQVTTDIDPVLDDTSIPAYDAGWDGTANVNLKVTDKQAVTHDEYEGYYWMVNVTYATPTGNSDQDALDPRARPWDWSKFTEKYEETASSSLFDTSGYDYPTSISAEMFNLGDGDAIANTAGQPPEGGVPISISNNVFTMTKYVDRDGYDDIVTGATGWDDLDSFIDSVNTADKAMLGTTYSKWQLKVEDITYEPYSENGYDVMRVTITVKTDTFRTHVFAFPSAGYKQIVAGGKLEPILDEFNQTAASPQLLDIAGKKIAEPGAAPYTKTPIIVSVGVNKDKSWTTLLIPATIP